MEEYLLIERGSPELFLGGTNSDILFLGQDPTIVSPRHIPVVLDLKNRSGKLYKYIFDNVCKILRIRKNRVLAWNLVNRYFTEKPRILASDPQVQLYLAKVFPQLNGAKNDWKTVRFLYYYFLGFGKQEMEYIVSKYQPKLLISLGEPVYRVLRHVYAIPQSVIMPENLAEFCCDKIFNVNIGKTNIKWLALPHEPTGDRNPHYKKVLEDKLPLLRDWLAKNI